MSARKENPAPALEADSEVVVVIEGGTEWSPFDKARLILNSADWLNLDPSSCAPMRAADIIADLEKAN